jgi:hypothetical protein
MDLQTTVSDKHVSEDLELQLAESVSKIKFQKRKLVHIEETRDGKIERHKLTLKGRQLVSKKLRWIKEHATMEMSP